MKKMEGLKDVLRVFALLPAALFLASCGGESDNFASGSVGTVASCADIPGATCVKGRLIDDAAVNVNYECGVEGLGTVNNVTAIDGQFVCPVGSTVTFSLTNPDNKSARLVLGSATVTRPANIYSNSEDEELYPVYFYVTPRDLAQDLTTVLSDSAINIGRLLHGLSTTVGNVSPTLPSYRVIIDENDKRNLTVANVEPIEFSRPPELADPFNPAPGTFDASVLPYLQTFTPDKQLLGASEARKRITRGIYSTMAGVYESYDLSAIALSNRGGLIGSGSGYFVGAVWNLVDRKGRTQASGVYSYGGSPATLLWTDPKPFTLDNATWPVDAALGALTYTLRDSTGASTGQSIDITQGNIKREAVAGSVEIYRALFGESPDTADLGRWRMLQSSSVIIDNGNITMARVAPVAAVLDPDLWTETNISFPLAVTLTLRNLDTETCAPYGCVLGSVRMVVLSDGNVISDMNEKCGVDIDQDTLSYPSGGSEVPLGVVARILDSARDESGNTMETMTLLGMIPDTAFYRNISPYLPYLQFGSNFSEVSALRVNGGSNSLRMYGACTADRVTANQCSTADAYAPDVATWGNRYNYLRFLKLDVDDDTNPLYLNSAGFISSVPTAPASCVTPP